jgi:hypothetical protein
MNVNHVWLPQMTVVFLKFLLGIVYYFYADSVCRAFVIVLGKRIKTAFGYGEVPVDLLKRCWKIRCFVLRRSF